MALPLGGEAGGDDDLAVGLDPDVRALVRPDPGALDVAGEPDADPAALGPACGLVALGNSSQPTSFFSLSSDAG